MSQAPFIAFAKEQIPGAIVVNVFAILSALALVSFALRIFYLAVIRAVRPGEAASKEYIFFHTQLGYYAAGLLFANMFNSISGVMGIISLFRPSPGIFEDDYCTAQGVIMQFGNISTAYFTLTIGIHTFNSLVLRKRHSIVVYGTVVALGWILSGVIAALPLFLNKTNGLYYGVSGLSCGLKATYPKFQFLLHLLPIFITAISSAVLYSLIFLVLRGTLVLRGGFKLHLSPTERWSVHPDNGYHKFVAGIAKSMLWYPAAYILLLVPYSVTRLFALSGFVVPFQAVVFAFICWFLLGVVNVLLLYNTLRVLSPAFDSRASGGKDAEASAGYSPQEKPMDQLAIPTFSSPLSATIDLSSSSERGLVTYPQRTVSISSYYNYPVSSQPAIGSYISRLSILNQDLVPNAEPEAPRSIRNSPPSLSIQDHSREGSMDSLISLPAPPRRTRSPNRAEPIAPRTQFPGLAETNSPITARSASPTMSSNKIRASVASEGGSDLDITSWLARQNADGSMPGMRTRPLPGSAVTPSFPSLPSPSTRPKQSTGPRPLFLSEGEGSPRPFNAF
ncbi:hypothetical protein C8J56DRAFT_954567 [Mycena floridula]|nr:hypothetical protein C8J56DRAFT_954567 [Mycena floridula]